MHPAETDTTRDLVRGHATLGDLDLTILTDGTYLLDGGAMFGVVPKPLWEKRTPANERNQILLGTNTVVVRTGKHTVVIETGIGNKLTEKQRGIFDARQLLLQSFDSGANQTRAGGHRDQHPSALRSLRMEYDAERRWQHRADLSQCALLRASRRSGARPSAAGARCCQLYQRKLRSPHRQRANDSAGYSWRGQHGDCSRGECRGVSRAYRADDGGDARFRRKRACYISDLVPTSAHLDVTWVMGYDLYPLTCIEQRKRFLSRAIPERWLVLFTHDHHHPMGYVEWGAKGKPEFVKEAG